MGRLDHLPAFPVLAPVVNLGDPFGPVHPGVDHSRPLGPAFELLQKLLPACHHLGRGHADGGFHLLLQVGLPARQDARLFHRLADALEEAIGPLLLARLQAARIGLIRLLEIDPRLGKAIVLELGRPARQQLARQCRLAGVERSLALILAIEWIIDNRLLLGHRAHDAGLNDRRLGRLFLLAEHTGQIERIEAWPGRTRFLGSRVLHKLARLGLRLERRIIGRARIENAQPIEIAFRLFRLSRQVEIADMGPISVAQQAEVHAVAVDVAQLFLEDFDGFLSLVVVEEQACAGHGGLHRQVLLETRIDIVGRSAGRQGGAGDETDGQREEKAASRHASILAVQDVGGRRRHPGAERPPLAAATLPADDGKNKSDLGRWDAV